MIKKLASLSTATLLCIAVLVTALISMGMNTKDYLAEKTARRNGTLTEITLTGEDFQKEGMRWQNEGWGWSASDGDPQMILQQSMVLTGVEFYMEYTIYPGEILMYYTTVNQPQYTNANMAVMSPIEGRDGWFGAYIPATEITSVRIDPTTIAGNFMSYGDFVVNPQRTLTDYLMPSSHDLVFMAVYSLALFAVLSFVKDFFTKYGK